MQTQLELKEKNEIITREREELRIAHRRLSEAMDRLQEDIRLAAEIQTALLPAEGVEPLPEAVSIVRRFSPEMAVGGDFFDFAAVGESRLAVILSDVSGHGLQGAFVTGLIKTSFELAGDLRLDAAGFVKNLNSTLHRLTPPSNFATILYCVYEADTRSLHYVNAGHMPLPIYMEPGGEPRPLSEQSNLVLGVTELDEFSVEQFEMPPGAKLLLATDGLMDAQDLHGERFGYERMLQAARKHADARAADFDNGLFEELMCFTKGAPQPDDIAMLTFEFL